MFKRIHDWFFADKIESIRLLDEIQSNLKVINETSREMSIEYDKMVAQLHALQGQYDKLLDDYEKVEELALAASLRASLYLNVITEMLGVVHPKLRQEIETKLAGLENPNAIQKGNTV